MLLTALAFAAADADFSGTWKLNPERSEMHSPPQEPYETIKIEHKDKRLHCSSQNAERKPVEWNYTTDGKETRGKIGDESYNSILKWEGSALLINTLVNGRARNHAQMDRWKLSRDGKTLTIRRQVETLHGEVESIFIYEKQ